MTLLAKLTALDPYNTVSELSRMTRDDVATVYISSTGARLVSVHGFPDMIEIDQLAQAFCKAEALSCTMSTPNRTVRKIATVQERAGCLAVWNKINDLYQKSDVLLAESSYLFQAWSMVAQSITYRPDTRGSFTHMHKRLREFSPEDFKKAFPGKEPAYNYIDVDYDDSFGNGPRYHVWVASEEMITSSRRG